MRAFALTDTALGKQLDSFNQTTGEKPSFLRALGTLEALKDDFERGFLDDLVLKIEAEVAADYMGQAEALLKNGRRGSFDHVPAAVLSGAVLEKALKALCERQQPQIPLWQINLNPDKVCNFDCIYCEVDRRTPSRILSVNLTQVKEELIEIIRTINAGGLAREPQFREAASYVNDIRDFAFSGDGEPTMVTNFAECVQIVADVKREASLDLAKIVLVTDAAGLDKVDVKRGLEIMDANQGEVWGKLDAGSESYFRLVNRTTIRFDRILKNLLETARNRPIVVQTLFLRVHNEIMPLQELTAYCERLCELIQGGARIPGGNA